MAACPVHPDAEAVGTCDRCGRFFCRPEERVLDDKRYCAECGVRPDVDWLGHHYEPMKGKRSGLAWSFGVFGMIVAALGTASLVAGSDVRDRLPVGAAMLAMAAGLILFFSGTSWGRLAPFLSAVIASVLFAMAASEPIVIGVISLLLLLVVAGAGYTDLRSKLFYRIDVMRPALHTHYKRYGNNPLALIASRLAFVSLILPGLSAISLVLGAIALTRVNKKATPPVTNIGTALGAIFFSLFTGAFWALIFATRKY